MSRPERVKAFCFAVVIGWHGLLTSTVHASPPPVVAFDNAHAQAAASRPAGLSMELKLPKTQFFQGELIPATLVFRNDSRQPFHTWTGTYDRSGRIPDLGFRAVAEDGQTVPDPLRRYFENGFSLGGGLGNEADLGEWEITLPANQWLRFEHPGVYRFYGWSRRVKVGHKEDVLPEGSASPSVVELVSQIVTIQIDPLTPSLEQEVLARAKADLASDKDQIRHEAMERLRYLQTPAAREMLLPFVGRPDALEAVLALAGAPDPEAEADRLFQAVVAGRLPFNPNMLYFYPLLKEGHSPVTYYVTPTAGQKPVAVDDTAEANLLDAAITALRSQPRSETYFKTLVALFQHDPNVPEVCALLVKHQTDLADDAADELLEKLAGASSDEALGKIDKQEFLPLVRRAANPPRCSAPALKLLAEAAPEEARRLVIDDIQHPPFRHRRHFGDPHWGRNPQFDLAELMSLPDGMLLPELDDTLRERLNHSAAHRLDDDQGIESTVLLTARYASPALLPDVLHLYLPAEGRWACAIQSAVLRYWLRCNPMEGSEGLRRVLYARGDTGCYHSVLTDVLKNEWRDEALPLVLSALDDESEEVWDDAAAVLAARAATPEAAAKIIAAAERLGKLPLSARASDRSTSIDRQNQLVRLLLEGESWKLTREQLERLKELPNNRTDILQQIDQRLARTPE